MEKVRKFLEEFKKNPQAAQLLRGEKSLSADETVKRLADEAKNLGFDLSEAEVKEHFDSVRKKVQEKTDSVVAKIEAESDDVLEEAAGGVTVANGCENDHDCGMDYAQYCSEVIDME